MQTVADAEAFARHAHAGQTDKAGQPYTGHLGRVAARARAHAEALGLPEDEAIRCQAIGWLHDTVEDTAVTVDELHASGFGGEIAGAVAMLTKRDGRSYLNGIATLVALGSKRAQIVKLSDLEDNTDPSRPGTASLSPSHRARYERAKAMLREALGIVVPTPDPVRTPPLNTAWDAHGNLMDPSGRALGSVSPVIGGWRAWVWPLAGSGRRAPSSAHPTEAAARAWVETQVRMEREGGRDA